MRERLAGSAGACSPVGRARARFALIVSPNRVPVLLELGADGAKEVTHGEPIQKDLTIGAPTWTDLDHDGLREYVAPVVQGGVVGILVLLTERGK